jgi:cytochrome c biogenesis protein CcmG/thiol:disulfide interchange protein DsbE
VKRLIYILPVAVFLVLAVVLFNGLRGPAPDEIPSTYIGKTAPRLTLPGLDDAGFGPKDLAAGHVTVLNVFPSWCVPCREEVPQIAALGRMPGIQLIGFAYKDKPANLRDFLKDSGNPYARIGVDETGRAGIEWGVYYVPETFIIDGRGVIRERFLGPITSAGLVNDVLPAIRRAASSS